MLNKKVAEKALSLVGQGYIYGAKGQTCSPVFRKQQAAQYPDQADNILGTGAKWDGKPVWDCAQLTRAVAKEGGVTLVSGATSQWKKTMWEKCGTIDTLPQNTTVFVYRQQDGVMQHTGVALGDGTCVHAGGTAQGVIRQSVKEYAWTHWAVPGWPEEEDEEMMCMAKVIASQGNTVRMRVLPDENAVVVAKVPVGSQAGVYRDENGWALIELENGARGYMMSEFLQALDVSPEPDEETVHLVLPIGTARLLSESLRKAVGM